MDSSLLLPIYFLALLFPYTSFQFRVLYADTKKNEMKKGDAFSSFDPSKVTQLSWRPRSFLYKGFLSDEECDHIILLAKDKLEKSMVADDKTGGNKLSEYRTSSGMFLAVAQDEIVADIENRIAAWTFFPPENGEDMQILRYELGQKYDPHFDFFYNKKSLAHGGHRIATVLLYLSNVSRGGETIFPKSEEMLSQRKDDSVTECARNGFAVKPIKGDALLFFSLHPNATTDRSSFHGSCPVIEGEKWSATKWIHVRPFSIPSIQTGPEGCVDKHEHCSEWAAIGECRKNPGYMIGSASSSGFCRESCSVCS